MSSKNRDRDGYALWYKRLEECGFRFPDVGGGQVEDAPWRESQAPPGSGLLALKAIGIQIGIVHRHTNTHRRSCQGTEICASLPGYFAVHRVAE